jgi:hypothetical protein
VAGVGVLGDEGLLGQPDDIGVGAAYDHDGALYVGKTRAEIHPCLPG